MHRRFTRGAALLHLLLIGAALNSTIVVSVFGADPQALGQHDLSGIWLVQPRSAPGVATVRTVTFHNTARGITGTWTDWTSYRSIDRPLTKIHADGSSIDFVVIYKGEGPGGADDPNSWGGTFADANHLKMSWLAGDGTPYQTLVFERVTANKVQRVRAEAPKILFSGVPPLPALRDVPDNGLARTPVMGWNSWNHFAETVDDRAVRETADAIVSSGLRDAGYVYVNIDDAWQGHRDAQGILHPNSKFPDMKALADYVHSKGLKLGIYSSPGMTTCSYYLGSFGFEQQDAKTFATWGVDYLKYDWCSALEIYATQPQMQAVYQKMGEALRSTGRPIVYSLDNYGWFNVGKWGRKVGGNLWRVGEDSNFGGAWGSVSSKFEGHGDPADSGPGGWNDPDMMLIGNGGLTLNESRSHMALWAMLAAPLIMGNDVRAMTPDIATIFLNREVIAIDQDRLGKQGRRTQKQQSVEVWTKLLSDGATAVAFFNRGSDPAKVNVNWSELRVGPVARVRDLWAQTDLGELRGGYETTVVSHGVAFIKVMPAH